MSSEQTEFRRIARNMLGHDYRSHLAGPAGDYWIGEITDGHEDLREAGRKLAAKLKNQAEAKHTATAPGGAAEDSTQLGTGQPAPHLL